MRIICCVCTRQIIPYLIESDEYLTKGPPTVMSPGNWCCSECAKDLDENGNFPEE